MERIAVVFESFVRAGSQRHLVEILKGIHLFRPDLECCLFLIAPLDPSWSTFLPEVEQIKVAVVHAPYTYNRRERSGLFERAHNWISRHYLERYQNEEFYDELSTFDAVVCAQPFVADLLLPNLRKKQRLVFHLMEHLAQRSSLSHYKLLSHPRLSLVFMHRSQIQQLPLQVELEQTITWPVRLCPDHFQASRQPSSRLGYPLRLAHYSRISPMRLIDQVINAFAMLQQHTPATLRIAGFIEDPVYYQQLLAQIDHLSLTDSVQFVDPVPSPAEDPACSNIDLVWMISLSGHIGYAGIEAMAAGLPTLLLEVDSRAEETPPDPELSALICPTPQQLVERTLALQSEPVEFGQQQAQLVRRYFMTTKDAIDELTSFYIGSQ